MGNLRLVLLFVCFGALLVASKAARLHENFATTTLYKSNETTTDTKGDIDASTQGRYPNGYPNAKHLYDPVSGKYATNEDEAVTKTATKTDSETETKPETKTTSEDVAQSEGRYVHGYFNESGWDKPSQTETIPVEKSYKSTYTTVSKDAAGVFDRYPEGYPKSVSSQYTGPSLGLAKTMDDLHRYEEGYFGHAKQYLTKPSEPQSSFVATSKTVEPVTTNNPQERYPDGYFGNAHKTYGLPNPDYQTTKTTAQVGKSYTGNFNTMPYPATGVPFSPTGAGCRTAYWAKDVALWPQFFTAQSTMEDAFGPEAGVVFGLTTILQSLLDYKTDSYSKLGKSGATALFNSYERGAYPLSHMKVIGKFNAALITKEAAEAQALEFEKYNVDSISQGNACG